MSNKIKLSHSKHRFTYDVTLKQSILDDVHALVNQHRASLGLTAWDFTSRKPMPKTKAAKAGDHDE